MVVALGPGKFYGSSLPRPRIYKDVKFNSFRVDPPVPVTDPFMSWAEEAHWSMGGLSFQRHRLQGRIEGSVEKLRNQIEKSFKEIESFSPKVLKRKFVTKSVEEDPGKTTKSVEKKKKNVNGGSPSPPPPPVANKRRKYVGLIDEEEEVEGTPAVRKWPVRKLSDEFDLVSKRSPARRSGSVEVEMETVASRTRGKKTTVSEDAAKTVSKGKKRLRKIGEDNNGGGGASPRLVKGR